MDEDLLQPSFEPPDETFRQAVFARTVAPLRWRRYRRYATKSAMFLIVFASGYALSLLRPEPRSTVDVRYVLVRDDVVTPVVTPSKTPAQLELAAEQILVKTESARQFREAGDRYYRDYADYQAALRCYRNFLDEADPADLAVSPTDTSLLASLKNARTLEKTP